MPMLFLSKLSLFICLVCTQAIFAAELSSWSEGGHHLIAELAFTLLTEDEQQQLLAILAEHPRFAEDFKAPDALTDPKEIHSWMLGRSGYWPDIARKQPLYDRPTWHYELGSSLVLGDETKAAVPQRPGPLPDAASLETQELHISQAVELCRKVLKDKQRPATGRALAICWLGHLVADAHQPCHAGSLYTDSLFTETDGDRGANRIFTRQKRNLHAAWDQALGEKFTVGGLRRRMREAQSSDALKKLGEAAIAKPDALSVQTWLEESRDLAIKHVYTAEVLDWVKAQPDLDTAKQQPLELSVDYLRNMGDVSQQRAVEAAFRLAEVWRECLKSE
jgi:hypothetical protein